MVAHANEESDVGSVWYCGSYKTQLLWNETSNCEIKYKKWYSKANAVIFWDMFGIEGFFTFKL